MALLDKFGLPFDKSIKLQTRDKRDIKNEQNYDKLNELNKKEIKIIKKTYRNALPRTVAIPLYNCHGLTFASRRTAIYDIKEIHNILFDDKYSEIDLKDTIPGDIVLYFGEEGDIEHSGVVVSKPSSKTHNMPYIVSKWGVGSEYFHLLSECKYSKENVKFYRVKNEN